MRLPHGDALRLPRGLADVVEMLGVLLRRLVLAGFPRLFRGRVDVTHVDRMGGGVAVLRVFRHHLQHVEDGIVGVFLFLFRFLLFLELLRQVGGYLRGVALVEMLHQPFGNVGLAVVHRGFAEIDVEPVGEVLQQPDAFGVDAGGRQIDDFGDAVLAVRAGCFYVGEIDVGTHVHAQRIRDAVHHFAHAEAAGARAEVEHADAHDHAGLRRDASFGDGLVPIAFDVFHVQWNGVGVEFADRRSPLELFSAVFSIVSLYAHSSFSTLCADHAQ